ncbi:MAG: sulfurtransferase, partial [Gammaproteobacteria bacterium]|nr:sulfurtransferase [Gammaproteobacteria bacterium]
AVANNFLWLRAGDIENLVANSGGRHIIDAREAGRYQGEHEPIDPVAGHIPGSVNLPWQGNLDKDKKFQSAGMLRKRFQDAAAQPENTIHSCGSGVTACHNLLAMEIAGLHGSRLYAGSWSEWIADKNRPLSQSAKINKETNS